MTADLSMSRVVLITGAGGGLGQELVNEFIKRDWRVAAACHHSTPHTETEQLWPVPLDVTDGARAVEVVQQLGSRWGRLDVLINNAGVVADQLSWHLSNEDWEKVLSVNLKGAFLCSKAALRPMMKQRDGHIINIASLSGRSGQRGQANYAAAKAGLFGLTTSLARELGSRNIRVNAVLPGVLPTLMTASLSEERLAEFAAANALGRVNSTAEVARFIAFLAVMQNVSGQLFQLDSRIAPWA
jgi:3-oxoacyl-[acyl-carrier protein] reductase